MKKDEYLLFSMRSKCYRDRAWFISVFSVVQETEDQKKNLYEGKLIREPFGLFTILNGEKIKLDVQLAANEPLARVTDRITINREAVPNLQVPTLETSLGTALINLVTLCEPFNGRFPYQEGRFTIEQIETKIAAKLENTPADGSPRKDDVFYIDELLKFGQAVSFIETLSILFSHSVTSVGLFPAPGRKEFKKEVLKRYEGKLTNPVEMVKFETELKEFDRQYLKSDPSYGKFMSGKVEGARMAAYMTQGGESNNFTGSLEVTPIVQALEDGFPLDKDGFVAIANTIRYGSFARGAETVNGGVVAKALMRAADSWRITEGDCGATLGIERFYSNPKDLVHLVGRYVINKGQPLLIENEEAAKAYLNKRIILRSPQYCRRHGTETCEVCAGLSLSKYPTGLPIPLMEISGGILNDSLKQMHNSKLSTETVDLASVLK